ncbi:U-scoloptoxin(01)-Tl1a-like [Rhynchophorus ferrugineus]|uniref:Chitin-binding type-2 domain-containing protein n=1 Tax=Rhynchophorus ferrugineus TaxID=354439 RepID=A0A834M5H9_RHYFE|nr:hypothetical protein GWI33_015895 [Rhynchophorus ferrugineus]
MNKLVAFGFLLVLVSAVVALPDCPEVDGENPEFFPDPDDCGSFYECAFGTAFKLKCAPGTYYNTESKICDFIDNLDCGTRPTTPVPQPTTEAPSIDSV